ncbi:MAG: TatD family hydrolase [Treponema sp.]|jgi:TatD DNase family protein|nr:TatD family hydrolase [Treponema sp.]
MIPCIDTHAHLSLLARRGIDPHAVLPEAFAKNLRAVIDVSLESGDLAERVAGFSRYPAVRFASGLWPHAGAIERRHELIAALEAEITAAPRGLVCALGEFGLDHYRNGGGEAGNRDNTGEAELMELQLVLAKKLKLPVIIHSRDAAGETAALLANHPGVSGVIHCFSYGPEEAKTFLDLGYFISFAGNLTYKNSGGIREACRLIPGDRLLFETDCPYLAPVPYRGTAAHPLMVEETITLAAELRGADAGALAELLRVNTAALFGVEF